MFERQPIRCRQPQGTVATSSISIEGEKQAMGAEPRGQAKWNGKTL